MHDMEKVSALHTIEQLLKINKENTNDPIEKWAKMKAIHRRQPK